MTEDEMVGWHHHLNGHELEETLGVGDGVSKNGTQLTELTDCLTEWDKISVCKSYKTVMKEIKDNTNR